MMTVSRVASRDRSARAVSKQSISGISISMQDKMSGNPFTPGERVLAAVCCLRTVASIGKGSARGVGAGIGVVDDNNA
ncbi:hypothetical protein VSR73_19775 [Paraburkholderia ferrariae]|uniref:Uncharacterized protein n=2 Tax=Paraburkholderia ferrariae TaxID=386056 RepID=A0ABU9RTA1_9BURK